MKFGGKIFNNLLPFFLFPKINIKNNLFMNTTYSERLRHPKWQRRRLEILQRDNFTCQLCGDTETTLNIHHKEYHKGEIWEYEDDELITYCDHCHLLVHFFANNCPHYVVKKIIASVYTTCTCYASLLYNKESSFLITEDMFGKFADLLKI